MLETAEVPENGQLLQTKRWQDQQSTLSAATPRPQTGSKQQAEAIVQQKICDIVTVTETWWHDLRSQGAALDGYKLFRKERQGWRGGGVQRYVSVLGARHK